MQMPLRQTWDLDSIFPGGSGSAAFAAFLGELQTGIEEFRAQLAAAKPPQSEEDGAAFAAIVERMQQLLARLREAESFIGCLTAENQNDKKALQLSGQVKTLAAAYHGSLTRFDELLTKVPADVWEALLGREPLRGVRFALSERRELAREKLPPEQEALLADLAVDGYHGWGDLYDTTVAQFRMPVEEDGKTAMLSVGQAFNKLHTPDTARRKELFAQWERTWAEKADFCAEALNHLAGFRLTMYKHRGWDSVHKEPLAINRMTKETLDAMWGAIDEAKAEFALYLQRKAQLLGLEQLAWVDVEAPLGGAASHISYDDAARLIVDKFRTLSPQLADFAEMALSKRWIEAEDRPGKRPGGFCTSFPLAGQTRIFMTFGGTTNNVSTLAHELGHGYHQHVMNDMPPLAQEYAMNVAETASTFAELVVADALVDIAATDEERVTLLEDKIQRAVVMFMNIHARFIFETNFYAERRHGLVSVERLNELMVSAQRQAFRDALSEYHPHFWAAKLHFYATDVPFYNFPYTFGFLFSAGIYARAKQEGPAFEDRYNALLRDTGSMTVEELAQKHLGVDLTKRDFWQGAVRMAANDVQTFLGLTEKMVRA
ncbi:oligoendopeptidase [Gordoniibacillus kamchatkensis]|uniref:Oligoendopeptidase n=1 Tax=Gordoniibacillus kamchatkensis TaxID=1590651 RepID=A0ABR5ANE3_9BACL|nr:M3 family oligoendopeptidase [Paenibacillus sp. VKM B-2647]KIL42538.1 oligoendopeptidase [Paenibacillus sp. VKM B-2647]